MENNLARLMKQTQAFQSEYLKGMLGVMYLSNQLINSQQFILRKYNITSQQYNVLRILRGQYPKAANISLIKDRMLDKMCDASRIVDRLIKMEFVIKEQNILDKRNSDVTITLKALDILKCIDETEHLEKTILCKLSENEIGQLNVLIDKVLSNL
jgi:MarR family transcriptional regulator, multiple gene regulator MgrA